MTGNVDRSKQTPKPDPNVTAANALEILGAVVLAVGLGFIQPWIGIAAFGVALLAIGVLMELQ